MRNFSQAHVVKTCTTVCGIYQDVVDFKSWSLVGRVRLWGKTLKGNRTPVLSVWSRPPRGEQLPSSCASAVTWALTIGPKEDIGNLATNWNLQPEAQIYLSSLSICHRNWKLPKALLGLTLEQVNRHITQATEEKHKKEINSQYHNTALWRGWWSD